MLKESPPVMRRRLNTSDRLVRCQPLVSDSEASHFANRCEQVWREMSRKTAPRRYFTTGDIAQYTGLTQGKYRKLRGILTPGSRYLWFVLEKASIADSLIRPAGCLNFGADLDA